jgi:hypothetical protein
MTEAWLMVQTLSGWVLSPETTSQDLFSRTLIFAGTGERDKSTLVTRLRA